MVPVEVSKLVFALINILLVALLKDEVNLLVSPVSNILSKLIASPALSAVTNTESNWVFLSAI